MRLGSIEFEINKTRYRAGLGFRLAETRKITVEIKNAALLLRVLDKICCSVDIFNDFALSGGTTALI